MAPEEPAETEATHEAEPAEEPQPEPLETKVVDKRRFARLLGFKTEADEPAKRDESEAGDANRRLPSYVEELRERAERAESQARAEIEAARARLERHYESLHATARADMAVELLEVFDNLERAIDVPGAEESPLYEGLVATRDIFLKKLGEFGVEPVPSVGEPFDPEIHEAVDEVEVDDAARDGAVVEELQRGFRCGDRLVRPAIVRVGRAQAQARGEG